MVGLLVEIGITHAIAVSKAFLIECVSNYPHSLESTIVSTSLEGSMESTHVMM